LRMKLERGTVIRPSRLGRLSIPLRMKHGNLATFSSRGPTIFFQFL